MQANVEEDEDHQRYYKQDKPIQGQSQGVQFLFIEEHQYIENNGK